MALATTDQKTISVTRERVWRAWTEPEQIKHWNLCSRAVTPEKVGGALFWQQDIDGSFEHNFLARLRAIKPLELCEYDWYLESGGYPTTMRITFEPTATTGPR